MSDKMRTKAIIIKQRLRRAANIPQHVEAFQFERAYRQELSRYPIRRSSKTKVAVVVHLYYPESWPVIVKQLAGLQFSFDIFISLQGKDEAFRETILVSHPEAHIFVTPNRGRDVLPFLKLLPYLDKAGYEYLLKVHTKKSTHRTDGKEWFEGMMEDLLPSDVSVQKKLLATLEKPSTGIVGPAGQYVSLTVNFEANGVHMTRILNRLFAKSETYRVLQTERTKHGFFGGTMFWARLDTLRPITKQNYSVYYFEWEKGQIDATFAHALERVFCLVAEVGKKDIFEVSASGLHQITYDSGHVPDWSGVYIGPKG